MREKIKKVTEAFPDFRYDMESTMWYWVIYFWDKNDNKFFFEIANGTIDAWELERGADEQTHKVKISKNGEWIIFEDKNIDNLIIKTKETI